MQENDFEKQVQQKMEELQFHPSEPVWQKVELQIRKEKSKRRLLALLLPLLVVTGGALWYVTSFNNTTSPAISVNNSVSVVKTHNSIPATENNSNPVPAAVPEKKEIQTLNKSVESSKDLTGATTTNDQKGFETFLNKTGKTSKTVPKQKATTLPQKVKEKPSINEELHALVLQNEIENKTTIVAKEKAVEEKNVSIPFLDAAEKGSALLNNNSLVAKKNVVADIKQPESITDTTTAVVTPVPGIEASETAEKKRRNWEWTVTARAGASGLRNEVLNVFSNERADLAYASPSTGSGGTNNTPPAFAASSEIGKGLAWSIGAGVRKRMFRNAFVVSGLQYSRYSTLSAVGTQVTIDTVMNYNGRETSTSNYYRLSGNQSTYTTQYHYLELPLAFEYRLFKKVPLQIQHGISAGFLFSTNALYYDAASSVLYQNKQWLRKIGWQLLTAADYRLLQTPSFSLYLGPQVQWSLTPLQQPEEPKKHFLFFSGIQSRITF